MEFESTRRPSKSASSSPPRFCFVCGQFQHLALRTCDCCDDMWLVCKGCESGLVRLGSAS